MPIGGRGAVVRGQTNETAAAQSTLSADAKEEKAKEEKAKEGKAKEEKAKEEKTIQTLLIFPFFVLLTSPKLATENLTKHT